jgi:alkyl hydroperoxide reductase subunit F
VFQRQVSDAGIEVLDHTSVVEILGNEVVEGVRVERRGEEFTRAASAVVVKVGNLPNTEWCREALTLDHEGYVEVGATLQTSAPRIWAAGDVTRPGLPAIPVATGQGALAASAVRDALDRP